MMRRSLRGAMVWLVALLFGVLGTSCSHTPSYSDIKVERGGGLANANSNRPQTAPSTEPGNSLAPVPSSSAEVAPSSLTPVPGLSPSPDPSASPAATPAYLDQKTGQIRNLPLYPRSKVMSLQYGPINGTPQVMLQAICRAPFEKVTAFYDAVIKGNGWTVDDNSRGVNSYTWQLSRAQTDRAAIRIDKDQLGRVHIGLARTNYQSSEK